MSDDDYDERALFFQIVHVLYQENDWVYVISEENKEGFIPHSYCAQFGSQLAGLALNVKKKLPRDGSAPFGMGGSGGGPGKATSMNGLPQISMTSPGLPSSASQGLPSGIARSLNFIIRAWNFIEALKWPDKSFFRLGKQDYVRDFDQFYI